ncbi:MAG: NADPH-dependent glutamate synthase [Deltaproteobacteria bacterium]|jgi:glutamate synthase (NADPH) small chain|nr:NADPH-dependent glutamate synthase [Deltaproteobacteria bacterium]
MTLTPAERMKIPRKNMKEQPPEIRVKNFKEVPYGYTEDEAVEEATRCIGCKVPQCVSGCPVEIDIPKFIQQIADRDFDAAIETVKKTNLLPAVCGRVCPQETQCEIKCILGKKHTPVAIGNLERFIADYERKKKEIAIPKIKAKTGHKVAVVGAGPAGLTVAGDLTKMGHSVTVFEALHRLGGVLMYGIPEFRLPKEILESEATFLEKLGVEFKVNSVIGMQYSLDELFEEGYETIFLGTGAGLPYFMNIPGENLNGVYSANEYLTRSNLMGAYDFPNNDTPIASSKNVAVVGGGNVAMDSARTAKRLGAENVYIVYRRSEEEMPARKAEIHHAKEEGIQFNILMNPTRLIGDDSSWVTKMECLKMELGEPDNSGRRRPVPIKGSEFQIDVDCAVIAIGNGPNPLVPHNTPDLETNKWGNITADSETQKTSKEGVFAGGDIVLGAATVILAMGEGRRAARAMDEYLKTKKW